ncbi:MAG: hypothetical protein HC836_37225 [Richelia sp. RM2_1_2]|nr:hypothetical protein [Richelia sp. RM2_1_2]
MVTITIDCEVQLDLNNIPSQDVIKQAVEKINMALQQADLSCKPTIIPESVEIGIVKDKYEDAKKWYRSLSDEHRDKLLAECKYTGEDDFFDWIIAKKEADICIHKHCVCNLS